MDENPYSTSVEIFDNERVLKEGWKPEELPERDQELDEIRKALAPATRGVNAHNLFLFGKTGQGKTVAVDHELDLLQNWADNEGDLDLDIVQISAHNQSTSYQLAGHLIKEIRGGTRPSGIDQQTMFDLLYDELRNLGETVIIVIDEIDSIGTNDELLYELPRARANGNIRDDQWISIIGISNDLEFRDNLSPKVKDSLYDSELEFKPYDATQLEAILGRRAERAFVDGVLSPGAIPLCAAFAAQDEGSARQAIQLLYTAGELALNQEDHSVDESHVRDARDILERKRIEDGMRSLTRQDQLALIGVVALEAEGETPARTKQIYEKYGNIADSVGTDQLVVRRVRDHLQSLAMQGFLQAESRTTGVKGGQHYVFELKTDLETTLEILSEDGRVKSVVDSLVSTARAHSQI